MLVETYENEKTSQIVKIHTDDDAESPRQWDNLGTMICMHNNYTLGDDMVESSEELNEILKEEKPVIQMPLYLIDHSGISMSTNDYGDMWDSGCVGMIYATREKILDSMTGWNGTKRMPMKKRLTKKMLEQAKEILKSEVETYAQYLEGNVYGYILYNKSRCDHDEEHLDHEDSCWGFYMGDKEDSLDVFLNGYGGNRKDWK
jgi:hypothetical protein